MISKYKFEFKLCKQIVIVIIALVCIESVVLEQNEPTLKSKINRNLKAVAVLFRHGDRSPSESYPNDPFKNCTWFGGHTALSEIGALMHYNNGKRLRRRYWNLLPKNELYSAKRIYVVSSAVERCIMSAQSFMAGFLPPPKEIQLLPINWQPVAIKSVPIISDYMLAQMKPCQKYDHTMASISNFNDPEINELFKENPKLFKYLSEKSGQNITSLWDAIPLYDILQIQIDAHLKIPNWAQKFYDFVLDPLIPLIFKRYGEAYVVKRVKGGALLNDMTKRLTDYTNNESTVNINIYSGHDITIAALLSALEITNQTALRPDYASTLAIELHKNKALKNDYEVKIVYFKNADVLEPIIVNIPGCEAPCSYKQLNVVVEPILTRDFDSMCAIK